MTKHTQAHFRPLGCADEPTADEPTADEPTANGPAANAPAASPEEGPSAPPGANPQQPAAEFEGCPTSTECMNGCRARCEAEHGPMLDREGMAACAQAGNDPATCVRQATNEPNRQCFLTCRGLSPEDFPVDPG